MAIQIDIVSSVEAREIAASVSEYRIDNEAVIDLAAAAIKESAPLAIVRLSDGEAMILAYPKYVPEPLMRSQLSVWFGHEDISDGEISTIRDAILNRLTDRDVIPCPPGAARLTKVHTSGMMWRDAQLCVLLWKTLLDEGVMRKDGVYGNATINKTLQKTRRIADLLTLAKSRGFITRSEEAVANLENALGFSGSTLHKIPGESWSSFVSNHYPQRFEELCKTLRETPKTDIMLVGAGILGKIYCLQIAAHGGVAIDMGAVFDGWANDVPPERDSFSKNDGRWDAAYLAG